MSEDKREQSIRFLRSLKSGDEGTTIYQDIIDDVLAALDEARDTGAPAQDDKARARAWLSSSELGGVAHEWDVDSLAREFSALTRERDELRAKVRSHAEDIDAAFYRGTQSGRTLSDEAIAALRRERDELRAALTLVANAGLRGHAEAGCMWCLDAEEPYNPTRPEHIDGCPIGAALSGGE